MIHDFDKSSIHMYDWHCAACSCIQWMPKELNDQLRKSHKTFYCVNGHSNIYNKKTELEEIEGKLMNQYSKNAQLESTIKDLNIEIEKLKKSLINRIFK